MSDDRHPNLDGAKVYLNPKSTIGRGALESVLGAALKGLLPPLAGPEADGREHWRPRAEVEADPQADIVKGENGRDYWLGFGGGPVAMAPEGGGK